MAKPTKELALRMLRRLAEKIERADNIHHAGIRVRAEDWSELHQLVNEAKALLESCEEGKK
jgi:hypothetical protein